MDWAYLVAESIDYIEANLGEPKLGPESIAKRLGVGASAYQRAFAVLTGLAPSEYVRNRRLALAAKALAAGEANVLDVALAYGYESPESFSKAFKRLHGVNPKEAKKAGAGLAHFAPLRLRLRLRGDQPLRYRLREAEGFTLVGRGLELPVGDEANEEAIAAFWEKAEAEGLDERLGALPGFTALCGASLFSGATGGGFVYAIAAMLEAPKPGAAGAAAARTREFSAGPAAELRAWPIPPRSWVAFECEGELPAAIDETWSRVYAEWLPDADYEPASGPELELYLPPAGESSPGGADYRCELWIPLAKR
ncbi:MAG: AraC family transcriptional regulator [Spirochaetaceae bacterium]|nr:AraC family transcriptional regulator [Spirochaetaceae bacterium]